MATAKETLEAMRERLRWHKSDVVTILAMADLSQESGEPAARVADLRAAARLAGVISRTSARLTELEELVAKQRLELITLRDQARSACPHPVIELYPDASGNNDSTEVCLCCGQLLR